MTTITLDARQVQSIAQKLSFTKDRVKLLALKQPSYMK
jgi:hypothetical protein